MLCPKRRAGARSQVLEEREGKRKPSPPLQGSLQFQRPLLTELNLALPREVFPGLSYTKLTQEGVGELLGAHHDVSRLQTQNISFLGPTCLLLTLSHQDKTGHTDWKGSQSGLVMACM